MDNKRKKMEVKLVKENIEKLFELKLKTARIELKFLNGKLQRLYYLEGTYDSEGKFKSPLQEQGKDRHFVLEDFSENKDLFENLSEAFEQIKNLRRENE